MDAVRGLRLPTSAKHGEGEKYRALPEFNAAVTCHAKFHQAAADIVQMVKTGKKREAEKDLDSGAFANASVDCMLALDKLKKTQAVKA